MTSEELEYIFFELNTVISALQSEIKERDLKGVDGVFMLQEHLNDLRLSARTLNELLSPTVGEGDTMDSIGDEDFY